MSQADERPTTIPTRRALLAAGPTVAAATLAAGGAVNILATTAARPSSVDPIFAAIERHRAAYYEHYDRCSALDAAKTPEAKAELIRLTGVLGEAEADMRETEPTTIAGAVAFLRYVAEHDENGLPFENTFDAALLATALEKIEEART